MNAESVLPRHTLVWLAPDAAAQVEKHLAPEHVAPVREWLAAGFPFVRRRPGALPSPDCLPLGLPLPPSMGRTRIGLLAPFECIRAVAPPVLLQEALAAAPAHWRAPLADLHDRLARQMVSARVYGSLAWQHLTGLPYLTPESDIDLLFSVSNVLQLQEVLAALTGWEADTGLRADGELAVATGEAVAWRELLRAPDRVMVKSLTDVALLPWQDFLDRI